MTQLVSLLFDLTQQALLGMGLGLKIGNSVKQKLIVQTRYISSL
jgi:hypothetical protein